MSRPLDDPTSWIGAYSEIMDEKWTYVVEGFDGCPAVTLTNPKSGAYAFFRINEAYLGIQKEDDFYGSFFKDVLGIAAPAYNWGFRGADPADFYGTCFSRSNMQLSASSTHIDPNSFMQVRIIPSTILLECICTATSAYTKKFPVVRK